MSKCKLCGEGPLSKQGDILKKCSVLAWAGTRSKHKDSSVKIGWC